MIMNRCEFKKIIYFGVTSPETLIENPKFPVYLIIWYLFNLLKVNIYCHWYDCIDFYYLLLN